MLQFIVNQQTDKIIDTSNKPIHHLWRKVFHTLKTPVFQTYTLKPMKWLNILVNWRKSFSIEENKKELIQTPLVLTYNQTIPNFRKIIEGNWSLLKTNYKRKSTINNKPITAHHQNKNLKDIIGRTTVKNSKVLRKQKRILTLIWVGSNFTPPHPSPHHPHPPVSFPPMFQKR